MGPGIRPLCRRTKWQRPTAGTDGAFRPVPPTFGLPALRLRGINLAILTLGFAVAFGVVLGTITFPGQTSFTMVKRPAAFETDQGYFVLVLIVYALFAFALELVSHARPGPTVHAVMHSERAASALCVSVPRAKRCACAISSFSSPLSLCWGAGYPVVLY